MSQQPQTTTLSELKKPVPPLDPSIKAGFDTVGGFDLIQRTANLFAASNIVPQQFQGNLPTGEAINLAEARSLAQEHERLVSRRVTRK